MAEPLSCDRPATANHAQLYELLITELTDFAVFLTDPEGCIVSWNPGVERIFGYAESEWIGQSAEIIFTPEDRAAHQPQQEMAKAIKEGRAPDIRWHLTKKRKRLFVEGTLVALRDTDGVLLGFSKVVRDITERKQSEERLRRSEERFRAIVTQATVGIAEIAEGRFTFVNDRFCEITGRAREQLIGTSIGDITHADETARETALIARMYASGLPFVVDKRYFRPDGSVVWLLNSVSPVRDAQGRIVGGFVVAVDVTARREATLALQASEAKYRSLFDSMDEGFCIVQLLFDGEGRAYDYRFLETNPAFEKHTGIEQAVGKTMRELVPQHDDHWFDIYGRVALDGIPVRFENTAVAMGRHFEGYAFRVGDPEHRTVAVLFQDITNQKAAADEKEQLLRQIEAEQKRLSQVFAQAPVGVCVLRGRELVYDLANETYQNFIPGRPLIGRTVPEVIPELDPALIEALHGILDTGEPFTANERLIPLDRDRDGVPEDAWFNLVFQPLREPDGTTSSIVIVAVDVTYQVRARQELERVNRSLEEFAYVASHDLQEPLRMVNSYSQLLVRRLGSSLTEEQNQYVHFILHGVKRMETLIRDLLTYSRAVHIEGELATNEASVEEALAQATAAVQTRIGETGAIITHDPLPRVRCDQAQLIHVMQNLLSNALKYRKPAESPRIHISAVREDGKRVISVRDNGIGFDPAHAQRVFGLFQRLHTEEEYPGTGLGLAICQRIIERFGGAMWAESEPGVGSTFFFSLPGASDSGA